MAIKSNPRRRSEFAVVFLVMALVSVIAAAAFPSLYSSAMQGNDGYYSSEEFADSIYAGGYVLYYSLLRNRTDQDLTVTEAFFPQAYEALRDRQWNGDETAYRELNNMENTNSTIFQNWQREFDNVWSGLEYLVSDQDGNITGNGSQELAGLLKDSSPSERLSAMYSYYAVIHYNDNGDIEIRDIHGASSHSLKTLTEPSHSRRWAEDFLHFSGNSLPYEISSQMDTPRNITAVFAVPLGISQYQHQNTKLYYERGLLYDAGFMPLYWLVLLAADLAGALLARRWRENPGVFARVPLEVALTVGIGSLTVVILQSMAGMYLVGMGGDTSRSLWIPIIGTLQLSMLPAVIQLFSTMALCCISTYAVSRIFVEGFIPYLKRHSIIVGIFQWIGRLLGRLYRWLSGFDLTDHSDKAVLRIVLVNFVILTVLCCLWFAGIVGVLIYTVILFFALRHYLRSLKKCYGQLLDAVRQMADGRLNAEISDDLGPFSSLGSELSEVQSGFRRAVEAEVKSERMRTELISNVSHDLKTPLTAIITYVGLLKDESIAPEQRRGYVETLELKSKRLAVLIEDLFEMSKASSGNVELNKTDLDLLSLLRQVELEIAAELDASGVELRHRCQESRLLLPLDGEKASRIFENLLINVSKYAMPGTRAYIDVYRQDGAAVVEIKNVSRDPLDYDTADLTERFVRGDRSRNTEGSGLGLAIARSFTELHGGSLCISADGDLFKVTVTLPAPEQLLIGENSETEPEDQD